MTGSLADLADAADRLGWQAHRQGRADLRDTHWRYRDAIRAAIRPKTTPHRRP